MVVFIFFVSKITIVFTSQKKTIYHVVLQLEFLLVAVHSQGQPMAMASHLEKAWISARNGPWWWMRMWRAP